MQLPFDVLQAGAGMSAKDSVSRESVSANPQAQQQTTRSSVHLQWLLHQLPLLTHQL